MPGQKKRVWRGVLNWPMWGHTENGNHVLCGQLPQQPGRPIEFALTKEQAVTIGMALWKWGSE